MIIKIVDNMNELPLFEAVLKEENDGIMCVSLVDMPATEKDFVLFNSQENVKFKIEDEEKHLLSSVVMVADTPIYRRNEDGYEYNIIYHKDTLRQMAEKLLSDNAHNTIDIMHNGERLPQGYVNLVELYIVDEEKGIKPNFTDVPNGSLMATYKIHNEELWQMCKEGTFRGLSLEGYFSVHKEEFNKHNNIFSKYMDIVTKLKSLLVELESEEQVKMAEEEEVIVEETPVEEEPQVEDEPNNDIEEIKAKIEALVESVADLGSRVTAIEESLKETVETPIEEEPKEEVAEEMNKYARVANILKNK